MSQTVVINGTNYIIPDVGDEDWGQNVTDAIVALSVIGALAQSFANVVTVTTTPVTVVSGRTYLVNTTVARTLTLPTPALNAFFIVRDISGQAGTNNITLDRSGAVKIDNVAADKVLDVNNGFWLFVSDGTDWWSVLRSEVQFPPLAAAPASPATGQGYLDTTENSFKVYTGTEWITLGSF